MRPDTSRAKAEPCLRPASNTKLWRPSRRSSSGTCIRNSAIAVVVPPGANVTDVQASLMCGPRTVTWFALRKLRPTLFNDQNPSPEGLAQQSWGAHATRRRYGLPLRESHGNSNQEPTFRPFRLYCRLLLIRLRRTPRFGSGPALRPGGQRDRIDSEASRLASQPPPPRASLRSLDRIAGAPLPEGIRPCRQTRAPSSSRRS